MSHIYSDIFLDHLENTKNVGIIESPDGFGEARAEQAFCGDIIRITLSVTDNVISNIKFKVYGCAAVIAGGSLATEMVRGKSLTKAQELTAEALSEAFEGVPGRKVKCLGTVIRALHMAVNDAMK